MPKKKDNIQIIGTQGGICGYVDRDQVVYRSESSLTGKRTKIDPAFAGFRNSSNRMKEAVPIASALYRQLSKEQKQFALYRLLTGNVILLLKEGIDKTVIRETLFKRYIEPILAGYEYKIPPTKMRRSKPPLPGYTCIGHVEGFPRLKIWQAPDSPGQAPVHPVKAPNTPGQAPVPSGNAPDLPLEAFDKLVEAPEDRVQFQEIPGQAMASPEKIKSPKGPQELETAIDVAGQNNPYDPVHPYRL